MNGWFVVRSHYAREVWACENILRQGGEVYLPRVLEQVKRKGALEERAVCLFPGYLFVKTSGQWRFLLGTFGVAAVLMNGGGPAVMQERHIADLRAREGKDGLVVLPEKLEVGRHRFKVGEPIRVVEGLYAGFTGIYAGMRSGDRERVLLDFLGRKTSVLILGHHLESV